MPRPRLLPLALVLPALLAGCTAASTSGREARPGWLDRPDAHPACPADVYLCGVGTADGTDDEARAASRQRALEAIASSILVQVQATIAIDSVSRTGDDGSSWSESVVESIRVSTRPEDLPGADVADTWQSAGYGQTATLMRVRREHLLELYMPEVTTALAQAETLLAEAGDGAPTGRSLRAVLSAYQALASAYGPATRARVVGAPTPAGASAVEACASLGTLLVEASRRLTSLASALHIVKLSGDGQIGAVRGELPEPLRVRVELVGADGVRRPLAGLPMAFVPRVEGSASIHLLASSTDGAGQVAARVADLGPTGSGTNEIDVRPDLGRLAPDLDVSRLPAETFTYLLPTPGQTSVLVSIVETSERGVLQHPVLGEHLADHLSAFGFDVRTDASQGLLPQSLAGRRPEELAALLGDAFDYVIRGTAHARVSSRDQGLVWFRAEAQLQVVELRSGLSQVVSTGEVKQAAVDDGDAGVLRVMRALQTQLRARVEESFVGLFLPSRARS